MNELETNTIQTISSVDVAKMVEKEHFNLVRDIRKYIGHINKINNESKGEFKIDCSEYFIESEYTTAQNKKAICYLVTRKGCEFIANKLTGVKGTAFTAKYINRFHEMQDVVEEKKSILTDDLIARMILLLEKQNKRMDELEEKIENSIPAGTERALLTNPFNPGSDLMKERLDNLSRLVDQTAELCSMDRNKVLHYMYLTVEEQAGVNLKSYMNVFRAECGTESDSPIYAIVALDRLYEMAVEMNEKVIGRKKLFG